MILAHALVVKGADALWIGSSLGEYHRWPKPLNNTKGLPTSPLPASIRNLGKNSSPFPKLWGRSLLRPKSARSLRLGTSTHPNSNNFRSPRQTAFHSQSFSARYISVRKNPPSRYDLPCTSHFASGRPTHPNAELVAHLQRPIKSPVTHADSALPQVFILISLKSFRMTTFRKTWGYTPIPLTSHTTTLLRTPIARKLPSLQPALFSSYFFCP
jgi:hypothetical protein